MRERLLGPDHPDIAEVLNNLAVLLQRAQGRPQEAEPLYQRALVMQERLLGPHHHDVARTLSNLGFLLCDTDRAGEGIAMLERAKRILQKAFPDGHPNLVTVLRSLATAYSREGLAKKAKQLRPQADKMDRDPKAANTPRPPDPPAP